MGKDSTFFMKVIFLTGETSGCRLMCKQLIECFDEKDLDSEEFVCQSSTIEYLEEELKKVDRQKIIEGARMSKKQNKEDDEMDRSIVNVNNV